MRKLLGILLLTAILGGADQVRADAGFAVRPIAGGAEILTPDQTVRVEFETDRIVHVTKRPRAAGPARPSLIVLPGLGTQAVGYAEEPSRVLLWSKVLRVAVDRGDGAVSWSDPAGAPILSEIGAAALGPAPEPDTCSASVRFQLKPDEGIYGLGQHQSGLMDYRGHSVTLVQSNTQSAIPFLVSTRGYGILWDNYSKTVVSDTPAGCSFWSEIGEGADYHFIYGGSIDGAIAGYRWLTGVAPLYGKWAYGYFQSKEHYASQEELLRIAAEYRARHLPLDCLVQDWDYWGDTLDTWNAMSFDPARYPHPTEMIDALHRENVHFMISIWCAFGPNTAVGRELERRGMLYPTVGWAGFRYFDAYNPAATDLYWKYLNAGLFRHGVDGWWMDSTEPDVVNALTKESEDYELKRMAPNHLGSFARYLNTYPLMATEAVYRNQRSTTDRKRVYILTRSTFAGQQRAAATTWSGDIGASWEVLRHQITAGLNHSMAGVPYWTFDIGGFVLGSYHGLFPNGGKDPAYQELYTRMFQFGAFCPIFRAHGSETPREIWEFGKYSAVLAAFDRLRYRLMPYIYSTAWRVTHEGYTLMRGLAMDYPQDGNTYRIADQFMFGPSLMVCPVTDYMEHRPPAASVPVAPEHFRTADGRPGLDVVYYGDDHFGTPVHYATEPDISLDWYTGWPSFIRREKFSMRWEGFLIPGETGPHRFHFKTFGPRLLTLDGRPLKLDYVSVEAVTEPVDLVAGRAYRFTCATSNGVLGAFRAQLYWFTPAQLAAAAPAAPRPQTRPVYLPRGGWFDFWTGEPRAGGRSFAADAPLAKIPLLVPAGSILPLGPAIEYAAEKPDAPLEVRVYPGADATFTLYDDEGDNYDYEKGAHATVAFAWNDAARQLTIGARAGSYPGMPAQREFRIVLVRPGHGAGPGETAAPDQVVRYAGAAQTLQF